MGDDLVNRLRHADASSMQKALGSGIFGEAADRIEAAEAALKEAVWLIGAPMNDTDYDEWTARKAAFLARHKENANE